MNGVRVVLVLIGLSFSVPSLAEQSGLNLRLGVAGSFQESSLQDFDGNSVDHTPIGKLELSYGFRVASNLIISATWFHASSLQANDPGLDLFGADLVIRF